MSDRTRHIAAVTTRIALAAVVALVAAGAATETEAHERHHGHGKHARAYHAVPVYGYRVAPVIVPRYLRPSAIAIYRPYYSDRVWFAGHRHFHALYRFPVATAYGIVYRPFAYCNDAIFEGDRYEAYDRYDDRHDVDGYVEFLAPHARIGVRF